MLIPVSKGKENSGLSFIQSNQIAGTWHKGSGKPGKAEYLTLTKCNSDAMPCSIDKCTIEFDTSKDPCTTNY